MIPPEGIGQGLFTLMRPHRRPPVRADQSGLTSNPRYEFYRTRASITQYLIQVKGLNTVALEAGWLFVTGESGSKSIEALDNFLILMKPGGLSLSGLSRNHKKRVNQSTCRCSRAKSGR
jgi:hypothetical protein